ncbi:hypothetical protein [Metabacillus arenae]|uniref:Uncharacterized protein n=1 Tax=Metabacillus arenae TaxID=2771434 RepID=A0A926NP45_9BACI|nr:hypothetical protein [Metabacillus arenae]MBD1381492.1 hypothetical protein [Metabacillus arenae]
MKFNVDFVASERPNNIFYGDVCKVNNKGCLIFGFGKTQAARIASESDEDDSNMIATDMACLTNDNDNNVYGHFEMEVRHKKVKDPINDRVKIHYLLRMLNEEETTTLYKGKHLHIIEVAYDFFIKASQFNITFVAPEGFLPPRPEGFPETEKDPQKRIDIFKELTQKSDVRSFLVPWMDSVTSKGELINSYLKNL